MDTIDKHKTDDSNHLDTLLIIDNEFQQALLKILNDPKSPEAVKIEQKLWSLFLKCYKSNSVFIWLQLKMLKKLSCFSFRVHH